MPNIQLIISLAFVYSLTIFWTWIAFLRMLFTFFRNPSNFFYVKERPIPPSVLTANWNHAFVQLSDIKLHYVHAGDDSKPLMLFIHGFPEFWYSWRFQLLEFQKNYKVVAIDMRGYGGSEKPSGVKSYGMPFLTKDIKECILALGKKDCILVAHDWGGAVAWQFTLQNPEMVQKLIICNCPHPGAFQQYLRSNITQLLKSWYIFFFQSPCLPELYMRSQDFLSLETILRDPKTGIRNPEAFTDEDVEAFKFNFSQPGALTPPINYYRNLPYTMAQNRGGQTPKMVKPPVLIIWGTADLALEKGMANLSANYCERAVVKYVEGATHWVQQDNAPAVNKYLREFVSQ